MKEDQDKNIKNAFQQMGDQAKQEAPSFDRVWSAARKDMAWRKRRRLYVRVSVAASAAILMLSVFLIGSPRDKPLKLPQIEQLTTWESPTDLLLRNVASFSYQGSAVLPTDALMHISQEHVIDDLDNVPN